MTRNINSKSNFIGARITNNLDQIINKQLQELGFEPKDKNEGKSLYCSLAIAIGVLNFIDALSIAEEEAETIFTSEKEKVKARKNLIKRIFNGNVGILKFTEPIGRIIRALKFDDDYIQKQTFLALKQMIDEAEARKKRQYQPKSEDLVEE